MPSFNASSSRSPLSPPRAGRYVSVSLATLCLIAVVGIRATASIVIAATDPDWSGTAPREVSQSGTDEARQPAIAVNPPSQVVAVWRDRPFGESRYDIYAARSNDQGRSWLPPARVSESSARSQLPDIAIGQGTVFVAWAEENTVSTPTTFKIYETELGSTSQPRLIPIPDADAPSDISTGPRLATSLDRMHVVFNAGFNAGQDGSHIFHSSRTFAEDSWPTATQVYGSAGAWSLFPALAVRADGQVEDLHLVWERVTLDSSGRQRNVLYMRGDASNSPVSWASALLLSGDTTAVKPDIAVTSSGDVHVVWGEVVPVNTGPGQDPLYHYYVGYRQYSPASGSWSDAVRIDPNPVLVNQIEPTEATPRLALWESGVEVHLCVAWNGYRDGEPAAEDALLSCSKDRGQTWQTPRIMSPRPEGVDDNVDISTWPSIAFDASGTLHGTWRQRIGMDEQGSYYEIYYAHMLNQVFLPLVIRNG